MWEGGDVAVWEGGDGGSLGGRRWWQCERVEMVAVWEGGDDGNVAACQYDSITVSA